VIEKGVINVRKILPTLRAKGSYTIIDKVTVSLNIRKDQHEAGFSKFWLRGLRLRTLILRSMTACCVEESDALSGFNIFRRIRWRKKPSKMPAV